jgi:hypothetical protein
MWWFTCCNPSSQEAEQENLEFEASLDYIEDFPKKKRSRRKKEAKRKEDGGGGGEEEKNKNYLIT